MAETPTSLKRQREQQQEENESSNELYKRQKSYKDIMTLLEEEVDDPADDLSSLISTLQDEINSNPVEPENNEELNRVQTGQPGLEEVMKHLLEASDDELGIPTGNSSSVEMDGGDLFDGGHVDGGDLLFSCLGDGLWEFEDHEAANYYNMLQSDNHNFF